MAGTVKRRLKRGLAFVLAFVMVLSMGLVKEREVSAEGENGGSLADGVYKVTVNLIYATDDNRYSMGNAAVRGSATYNDAHYADDPNYKATLIVENGQGRLVMDMMPMAYIGMYGYLLEMNLLTDIQYNDYSLPESYNLQAPELLAEHRMVNGEVAVDAFNVEGSSVEQAVGKVYPKTLLFALDNLATEYHWVQVFVPVMESIGAVH